MDEFGLLWVGNLRVLMDWGDTGLGDLGLNTWKDLLTACLGFGLKFLVG